MKTHRVRKSIVSLLVLGQFIWSPLDNVSFAETAPMLQKQYSRMEKEVSQAVEKTDLPVVTVDSLSFLMKSGREVLSRSVVDEVPAITTIQADASKSTLDIKGAHNDHRFSISGESRLVPEVTEVEAFEMNATVTESSRGMRFDYDTKAEGWAGAGFSFAVPMVTVGRQESLLFGIQGDAERVKLEMVDIDGKKHFIYLDGIRADQEQVWNVSLDHFKTKINMDKISHIYFIVEGAWKQGSLIINRRPIPMPVEPSSLATKSIQTIFDEVLEIENGTIGETDRGFRFDYEATDQASVLFQTHSQIPSQWNLSLKAGQEVEVELTGSLGSRRNFLLKNTSTDVEKVFHLNLEHLVNPKDDGFRLNSTRRIRFIVRNAISPGQIEIFTNPKKTDITEIGDVKGHFTLDPLNDSSVTNSKRTSRGLALKYDLKKTGWAGTSFVFDDLGTSSTESVDLSQRDSLVLGLKGPVEFLKIEFENTSGQKIVKYVRGIKSDEERAFRVDLTNVLRYLNGIRFIHFIVDRAGPNGETAGMLEINHLFDLTIPKGWSSVTNPNYAMRQYSEYASRSNSRNRTEVLDLLDLRTGIVSNVSRVSTASNPSAGQTDTFDISPEDTPGGPVIIQERRNGNPDLSGKGYAYKYSVNLRRVSSLGGDVGDGDSQSFWTGYIDGKTAIDSIRYEGKNLVLGVRDKQGLKEVVVNLETLKTTSVSITKESRDFRGRVIASLVKNYDLKQIDHLSSRVDTKFSVVTANKTKRIIEYFDGEGSLLRKLTDRFYSDGENIDIRWDERFDSVSGNRSWLYQHHYHQTGGRSHTASRAYFADGKTVRQQTYVFYNVLTSKPRYRYIRIFNELGQRTRYITDYFHVDSDVISRRYLVVFNPATSGVISTHWICNDENGLTTECS